MYQLFAPDAALQPYIETYWFLRTDAPLTLTDHFYVDGRADVLFNFGVDYTRTNGQGTAERLAVSHLDAQRDYPLSIAQHGMIDLIGVRFRAGGVAAFTRMPLSHAFNLTVSLRDLWGSDSHVLESRLYHCADLVDRVRLLDSFFLRQYAPHESLPAMMHIAHTITHSEIIPRVAALSDSLGYSPRNFDRLFKHVFGYTPKFYTRIVRFQRALSVLERDPSRTLADLAFACGYYDQAHFTHEFRVFAGKTPSQLRGTQPSA
jgi:AraC-like DNA-binding protein